MMVHMQIAEAGRQYAQKGDHEAALERYRHALKIAVDQKAPDVFLQYYTTSILDTLEAAGLYDQALELTSRAIDEQTEQDGRLSQAVRADLMQRRVLLLFLQGQVEQADAALDQALPLGGPILKTLAEARRRHLTITSNWLSVLRRKYAKKTSDTGQLRSDDAAAGEKFFMTEIAHG